MIILTVIFIMIASFLGGLAVGCHETVEKPLKKTSEPLVNKELNEEYENFLSYDGSVQN